MPGAAHNDLSAVYAEMERVLLANGELTLDTEARKAFRTLYSRTVGHYLRKRQPDYGYDLWHDDERFRRTVLTGVHEMSLDLRRRHGSSPSGSQVEQAGRELLERLQKRIKRRLPWECFVLGCPIIDRGDE